MEHSTKDYNESFDKDFCLALEFSLSAALKNSNHRIFKYYWCDGIKYNPFLEDKANFDYLSIDNVCARKFIQTDAWFGKSGQEIYSIKIQLGLKALELYKKGQNLICALPDTDNINWIKIDTKSKKIKVQLV